jgi:hypothetical protein
MGKEGSNHIHQVIRMCPKRAKGWTSEEVAARWLRLMHGKHQIQGPEEPSSKEAIQRLAADTARIDVLRERLANLSWFMAQLSEPIARAANREDDCTGRFWEGRFKCRKLADDGSVLMAMTYVDLQSVRAGVADSPEESLFTSAYERIEAHKAKERLKAIGVHQVQAAPQSQSLGQPPSQANSLSDPPKPASTHGLIQSPFGPHSEGPSACVLEKELLPETAPRSPLSSLPSPFSPSSIASTSPSNPLPATGFGSLTTEQRAMVDLELAKANKAEWLCPIDIRCTREDGRPGVLPLTEEEYFEFLDCTGRLIRAGKAGSIPDHFLPILERFGLNTRHWVETVMNYEGWFWRIVGKVGAMMEEARKAGRHWFKGLGRARFAFCP